MAGRYGLSLVVISAISARAGAMGLVHLATTCFATLGPCPSSSIHPRSDYNSRSSGLRIVSGSLTPRRANSASARPRTSAFAKASDELLKLVF